MTAPATLSSLRAPGRLFLAAVLALGVAFGLAATASAATAPAAQIDVGASTVTLTPVVGPETHIPPARHPGNDSPQVKNAVATRVAANTAAPRFIANGAGDILDTTRVTIPEGKFGYLLDNPSKSGVFKDSMGFDQAILAPALRSHLATNFGNASTSVPMIGDGTKFVVRGPLTGPSSQTWNITSAWGVDVDGTVRLITATP